MKELTTSDIELVSGGSIVHELRSAIDEMANGATGFGGLGAGVGAGIAFAAGRGAMAGAEVGGVAGAAVGAVIGAGVGIYDAS